MGRNQVETVKGTHKLEINYSLPIIGIPDGKVISFLKWFNEDLKDTPINEIPTPFDEGYLAILSIPFEFRDGVKSNAIKNVAKKSGSTFRSVEEQFNVVYKEMSYSIIIHYDFRDGKRNFYIYNGETYVDIGSLPLGKVKDGIKLEFPPIIIEDNTLILENADTVLYDGIGGGALFQNEMLSIYYALFVSSMWYLTLYKNRYKYEKVLDKDGVREALFKKPYERKNNNIKTITTSIYDLSRTPRTRVQTLMKKRAGFEYSHQFEVTGHYRHYKDGKVVYINQYTKCKDKPELGQKYLILVPKEGR